MSESEVIREVVSSEVLATEPDQAPEPLAEDPDDLEAAPPAPSDEEELEAIGVPDDANPVDVAEQHRTVPYDEDDYR